MENFDDKVFRDKARQSTRVRASMKRDPRGLARRVASRSAQRSRRKIEFAARVAFGSDRR